MAIIVKEKAKNVTTATNQVVLIVKKMLVMIVLENWVRHGLVHRNVGMESEP